MDAKQVKAIEEILKKRQVELNTMEKARHYFIYVLKTHNPDGTLTKEYGGKYTMPH